MKKEYDFSKATRAAIVAVPPGKTRITIRIDDDTLEWFREQAHRAGGGNYQSMMNAALREYVENSKESLESKIRKVVREELRKKRRGAA